MLFFSLSAIRLVLRLGLHPAFKKFGTKFYSQPLPACQHIRQYTDKYWECHIRQFTYLHWHDVGTCKMGPPTDPGAVVDPALRYDSFRGYALQGEYAELSIDRTFIIRDNCAQFICTRDNMIADAIHLLSLRHLSRVYGVKRLRVADASIMPVIVTGNTMAACIVIGEKASDLIKSTHRL